MTRHNRELATTAQAAGVITGMDFAIFQDHGYMSTNQRREAVNEQPTTLCGRDPGPTRYQHRYAGVPGLFDRAKNRRTRTLVSLYHASQAGLDATGGEWALVCEAHHVQRNYLRQAEAQRHLGAGNWCAVCLLARPLPIVANEREEAAS